MSIRIFLVAAVLYFVPVTVLANNEMTPLEQQTSGEESNTIDPAEDTVPEGEADEVVDWDAPETIVRRQSLAVHLGLTPSNVVFGQPRNFRTESLNNIQLEPLYEAEEN